MVNCRRQNNSRTSWRSDAASATSAKDLLSVIQKSPRTAHPMDALRTAVSFLGMEDTELGKDDITTPAGRQRFPGS